MQRQYQTKTAIVSLFLLSQHPTLGELYQYAFVEDLVDSMRKGPLKERVKVKEIDGNLVVLSGGRRLLAARELGWEEMEVEIILDLPDEEEDTYILDSNQKRSRTYYEKAQEIKKRLEITERRQGKRTDLSKEEVINTRHEIATQVNMKPWEVRDIITVSGHDEDQLRTIDGTQNAPSLSGMASQLRKKDGKPEPKGPGVEQMDLSIHSCPLCSTYDTPRIVMHGNRLIYSHSRNF